MAIIIKSKTIVPIAKHWDYLIKGNFSTTDATGTLNIGIGRKVRWSGFNWVGAAHLNAAVPQVIGTPDVSGDIAADASGNITIARTDATSGQAFQGRITYR